MTEYKSSIQHISYPSEKVFNKLSNLRNLESLTPIIGNQVSDFQCDENACSFKMDAFGTFGFEIVEKTPFQTIQIKSSNAPVDFSGLISIEQTGSDQCTLQITLLVDLPFFLKAMISSKLEEGIEKVVQIIGGLNY
jgi:uncharacterized membrane protein